MYSKFKHVHSKKHISKCSLENGEVVPITCSEEAQNMSSAEKSFKMSPQVVLMDNWLRRFSQVVKWSIAGADTVGNAWNRMERSFITASV